MLFLFSLDLETSIYAWPIQSLLTASQPHHASQQHSQWGLTASKLPGCISFRLRQRSLAWVLKFCGIPACSQQDVAY